MRRSSFKVLGTFLVVAWASAITIGAANLWHYDSTAGIPAHAPHSWPATTNIPRDPHLPTLVMLLHPQCPCSQASVGELARLMAHCTGKLHAIVLVVHPTGAPKDWERTSLWTDAAAIPGVTVLADDNGTESERFGAATSGQVLLYNADGLLLFSGGITESRGHSGDNAGESAVMALLLDTAPTSHANTAPAHTPVYGCSLFNQPNLLQQQGCKACRQ